MQALSWILVLTVAAASAPQAPSSRVLKRAETLEPKGDVVASRLVDLDGDARMELLVVAGDGQLTRWRAASGGLLLAAGELRLEDPAHALLDVAAVDGEQVGQQLLWAGPSGSFLWSLAAEDAFAPEARKLSSRARMPYRTGVPRLADLAQDVNHDGRPDLVLPVMGACELWLNEGAGADGVSLRRSARVVVDIDSKVDRDGRFLSHELSSRINVPNLSTRDVNGDGRPDLLVADGTRRSFFLQNEAGGFPATPEVVLDLTIFRDAGAEGGGVRPGQTLTMAGQANYQSRDLNGDRIPDNVIAQGRKVWVFLGSTRGPQFTEPLAILKTAEDITALTLARVDDDPLPDLLLFKVQVPTVATLLRGLFGEWDVEIGAVAYRNLDGTGFETKPSRRAEVVVRLPSIVRMLKNPAELLGRFEELQSRFRIVVRGDLDGDGASDLGLVTSDGKRLEVWIGASRDTDQSMDADSALREVFFESSDKVWDLDRILMWVGGVADRRLAMETGGRAANLDFALRDEPGLELQSLAAGDLDGDGREELVIEYRPADGGEGARFDVLRLED